MNQDPVYQEWDHRLVPASHAPGVYYRVFHGTVKWGPAADDLKTAVAVFIQYGKAEDWSEAIREGQLALRMPAHILDGDLPRVLHALSEVRGGN